jgi:DNA-directed RNA polymerase subunit A'
MIKTKAIQEEEQIAAKLERKLKNKTLKIIPGRTLEETFEAEMMRLAARIKKKVEQQLMKEKIDELLADKIKYDSKVMIVSGSRGSSINLTNISGLWGQASVREGRPKKGYTNRLISANKKGDIGVKAGGFLESNFMDGMSPFEYFYHAMGGRQGEVDTGVSTKVSGYLYRRLANSLKDLVVHNDYTVRTSDKRIIQLVSGEDAVFSANSSKGKTLSVKKEAYKFREMK